MTYLTSAQRVALLDEKLQTLRTLITFSASPRIDEAFRRGIHTMIAERWAPFRDGAAKLLDSLIGGTSVHEPRFQAFVAAHDRWAQLYNERRLSGEPEHAYLNDSLKRGAEPPPKSIGDTISDKISDTINDVTEPVRGAVTGFGAGVIACLALAIIVAWKR